MWWLSECVLNFLVDVVQFILNFVSFFLNVLFDVVELVLGNVLDHVEIIMNLILDVRSESLEGLKNWSEWARWVFWPCGSSSINDMVDLLLDAFVRNLFLGVKSDIESELLGINLSSIIREFTPVLDGGHVVLTHGVSGSDVIHIEESLEDFDSVIVESSEKIGLVNAFTGIVLAPLDNILNWDGKSAVFNC